MEGLMFNSVLRAVGPNLSGFYRVIAVPPRSLNVWLAYIGPCNSSVGVPSDNSPSAPKIGAVLPVSHSMLDDMSAASEVTIVELMGRRRLQADPVDLTRHELPRLARRREQMEPFFDHNRLCDALERTGGVGPIVREALKMGDGSRAQIYRHLQLLFLYGFEASSLIPSFDRCGAPGVPRPMTAHRRKAGAKTLKQRAGIPEAHPQTGVTEADRVKILAHYRLLAKPGVPFKRLYAQLVQRLYVTRYTDTDAGRMPILPPQGSFPNARQVRHIIESGTKRLERIERQTTRGHYERSKRSLRGRSYDHSPGPGHLYAIDATVGDVHLRSGINRAWLSGRAIVYLVVDVWSTAIVGFYATLSAPSWSNAKLALFSTLCDPQRLADLWGFAPTDALIPPPAAPATLLSDRGEYVSAGARDTCERLGIHFAINPAYRPDLKGMVEVLHRIAKEDQFAFVPGAIDARRRELELKPSARESALTLREYVQYLHAMIAHYNLHADRSKRMTAEMIAAGADPSPAGLWRFGHETGFGYRKAIQSDRLTVELLHRGQAISRRDGMFFESLQYEADIARIEDWSGIARNVGTFERTVFHFPGSTSCFWWAAPDGELHLFRLRANARATPDISLDEWRDALMYERMKRDDRQHRRLEATIKNMHTQQKGFDRAIALTAEAEASYSGPKPTVREVRFLEQSAKASAIKPVDAPTKVQLTADYGTYQELMDEIFAEINKEAGPC